MSWSQFTPANQGEAFILAEDQVRLEREAIAWAREEISRSTRPTAQHLDGVTVSAFGRLVGDELARLVAHHREKDPTCGWPAWRAKHPGESPDRLARAAHSVVRAFTPSMKPFVETRRYEAADRDGDGWEPGRE